LYILLPFFLSCPHSISFTILRVGIVINR